MTMTTPATTPNQAVTVDQSLLYPSPYKEFWHAFSRNKGAVAGLMFINAEQNDDRARELAEVDVALLTDELPPAAFADPGFLQFLKTDL